MDPRQQRAPRRRKVWQVDEAVTEGLGLGRAAQAAQLAMHHNGKLRVAREAVMARRSGTSSGESRPRRHENARGHKQLPAATRLHPCRLSAGELYRGA